jgi:3-oxoadipate enol-lactonase
VPYVQVKGIKLFYEDFGEGTPILFVHGWTSSSWIWFNQVEYFKKSYRVIALDLKGHGDSEKPKAQYLMTDFAAELEEFASKILHEEKFILVGLSMGGMIVLTYASTPQFSSRLKALVPCGTSYKMENPVLSQMVKQLTEGVIQYDRSMREMMTKLAHYSQFARKNREIIQKEVGEALKCPDYVAIACMDAFVNHYNIEKDLHYISVPTLFLAGDKDEMIDPVSSDVMCSLIPNATLKLIGPKVGHCLQLERPMEFNKILEEFIKSAV